MPPRRFSQCLHTNEAPPQKPTNQPTQTLSTIDGIIPEHPNLRHIHEAQPHQPTHASTSATGPSQTNGATTTSHTMGGAPQQSPPQAPSPIQMLPDDAKLSQVQIDDWDEEAKEEETEAEEEELARF
jgi:hypothetical protein